MKKILRNLVLFITLVIICIIILNQLCVPIITNRKAILALDYCKKHNLNTDYCIFVDFSKHPGKKRYCIYNFNTNKIEYSSVCANGLNKNGIVDGKTWELLL